MLSLKVSETTAFALSLEAASLSPLFKDVASGTEVAFGGVSESAVQHLIQYLEHYKVAEMRPSCFQRPLVSSDLAESGGNPFDCAFVASMSHEQVNELLQVAEKLEIASLIELMAACIARTVRLWKASGNMRMEAGFH